MITTKESLIETLLQTASIQRRKKRVYPINLQQTSKQQILRFTQKQTKLESNESRIFKTKLLTSTTSNSNPIDQILKFAKHN
jgi:hypothetical protein